MFRRTSRSFLIALAALGLTAGAVALHAQGDNSQHGRKYKAPPLAAHIEVLVVRDYNGKPIPQAHVIFHPVEGDSDKGSMELKTNDEGKAIINVIPIGDTVRLQVIANGFQTYGQDFKVDRLDISMEIRLKRPAGQFSLYGKPGSGNGSGAGNSSGSPPPASSSKPSDSPGKSSDQPDSGKPKSN
ncbi:MAG: carboxypeptidase-like regulatory domain-containing protein [Terracidiphilus sp.]